MPSPYRSRGVQLTDSFQYHLSICMILLGRESPDEGYVSTPSDSTCREAGETRTGWGLALFHSDGCRSASISIVNDPEELTSLEPA